MSTMQMKAYTLIDGKAQVYTIEASIANIANFIMSQPVSTKTIAITDMSGNLVCSTIGQVLDRVPDQRLLPFLYQHITPLQTGEKEPEIVLLEPMPTPIADIENFQMRGRPGSEELPNYLFEQETALRTCIQ